MHIGDPFTGAVEFSVSVIHADLTVYDDLTVNTINIYNHSTKVISMILILFANGVHCMGSVSPIYTRLYCVCNNFSYTDDFVLVKLVD